MDSESSENNYLLMKPGTCCIIRIFHVCMVWIEKSVTRVTDRHHGLAE